MSTKLNPGAYDCYDKIAPGEPFFVLRAKDPLAPGVVRDWANAFGFQEGDADKAMEANLCADAMEAWYANWAIQADAIGDQEKLFALEASLKLFAGHIEHADGMFRFVRTDGEGVLTSVSLRGLIEKMPKDNIPF